MADSRFRHLRPWMATWLTPRLPAAATCAALPEIPHIRESTRASVLGCPRARLDGSIRPLSQSSLHPARTDWRANCQDPFPLLHVNAAASASPRRLPPTGPVGFRPRLHSNVRQRAATGTSVLPPRAQLPTCVHAPTGSARPERTASYSLSTLRPHAAYRFLQLGDPRAHPQVLQTPLTLRRTASLTGSSVPRGPLPARFPQARGRVALHALAAPRRDDRSSDGFTPT